jgi:hypothetical protein
MTVKRLIRKFRGKKPPARIEQLWASGARIR